MAEFVWFFGASGVGKASLINKITKGHFKIAEIDDPIICHESLEFSRSQRGMLLERELDKYALLSGNILIKGQSTDLSSLRIPYHIKEKYPNIKQCVVFIYTEPDYLLQRTSHRKDNYWPNPNHDFVSETAFQIDEVNKLCESLGIKPIIINNSEAEPQLMCRVKLVELQTL